MNISQASESHVEKPISKKVEPAFLLLTINNLCHISLDSDTSGFRKCNLYSEAKWTVLLWTESRGLLPLTGDSSIAGDIIPTFVCYRSPVCCLLLRKQEKVVGPFVFVFFLVFLFTNQL